VIAATPLWVPILVAALGLLGTIGGTIGGVLLAQRRSDRRDDTNWNRERDRERERWAREDAARTFDHRREAYSDFYESLQAMALMAYNFGMGLTEEKELGEWQFPTYRKLQQIRLYATPAVAEAAGAAYTAAWNYGNDTTFGEFDAGFYEREKQYDDAETELLARIREDLSIPED
jgi:hypothetical protein